MEFLERFGVVDDVSDHFFRQSNENRNEFNGGTSTFKNIMREWKILQESLPDSIFVVTYESRIDLLRAVIIGAAGTPYHDGLFFFDIAFPPQYPSKPPKVQFKSYGLKINEHLYMNGTLCLSLINTTIGWPKERWNPSKSSILQLLLSIQALILTENPFFEGQRGRNFVLSKWMSQTYNESVFISSCKMMTFVLKNPPKNFEYFIADHFSRRAVGILKACEAYANGRVLVGVFREDDQEVMASTCTISGKFRRDMVELYPNMVSWFRQCGASLGTSLQELKLENQTTKAILKGMIKTETDWMIANCEFVVFIFVLSLFFYTMYFHPYLNFI